MSKTTVIVVAATSGVLFFLYLYGMSTLGNKKDLNIFNYSLYTQSGSNDGALFVSDDNNGQETIIGGTRKRKKRKRGSKKYKK